MATRRWHATDRSRAGVARATAAAAVVALLIASCGEGTTSDPVLVLDDSVAADFAALASTTFDEFIRNAPAVSPCFGSVRLAAATELDDRAYYSADSATITVRVPATAPSLRDSLVHELAHHVEASCTSHVELRAEFLTAQGHGPDQGWFAAEAWADTPSEQFAEAVVVNVLGERRRYLSRIQLEPEALAIVAAWLNQAAAAGDA